VYVRDRVATRTDSYSAPRLDYRELCRSCTVGIVICLVVMYSFLSEILDTFEKL